MRQYKNCVCVLKIDPSLGAMSCFRFFFKHFVSVSIMKFAVNSISKLGAWSMQTEFDQDTPSTHMWPCGANKNNKNDRRKTFVWLPFRFSSPSLL